MTHSDKPGVFITIEGIEGAGKSTAVQFIEGLLKQHHIPHVMTREPGGTQTAEAIRQLLLKKTAESLTPSAELLLMFAARSQHIQQVIQPALEKGVWVVCDRFTDASYAYQGYGRGLSLEWIALLESWVQGSLKPTKTFLLDIPVADGMARAKHRSNLDRIESENYEFFNRVRNGYLTRAEQSPERFEVIDARQPLSAVKQQFTDSFKKMFDQYL